MIRRNGMILALTVLFVGLSVTPASAFWGRWRRRRSRSSNVSVSVNINSSMSLQQICQNKASIQARRGRCFHPGGSMGGARYEGCGGGSTAQKALDNCCFSGARGSKGPRRTCIAQAVAQTSRGWFYATRLYR